MSVVPAARALLRPSARILAFIKDFEKCWRPVRGRPGFFEAYKPTDADEWTCGYGSTGKDVRQGVVWSLAECESRFARDLDRFANDVRYLIGNAPTTHDQFDALLSFAYNVGPDIDADTIAEGLGDSTLLKKHLRRDYAGAAAEFAKWNKQKGVVLAGLVRRRAAEAAIYRGEASAPAPANDRSAG